MDAVASEVSEPALPLGAMCAVHVDASAALVCTRCGNFACAACAFSSLERREVCRGCAASGLAEPIPWERRREIGNWRAYWDTARLASREPSRFFRTPTIQKGAFGAVAHGAVSVTIALVLTYVVTGTLLMISGGASALLLRDRTGDVLGAGLGMYGCAVIGMSPLGLLFGPANAIIGTVIAAGASHASLSLMKKNRAPFEDTLRAIAYANAPAVWSWIPIVGWVAYPWTIAVEVIALRELHRCRTDAAVIAAVGYRVLVAVLFVGGYAALLGSMIAIGAQSR